MCHVFQLAKLYGWINKMELDYEKQIQKVPDLDEGHSGNSFGVSCRLAYWFIKEPEYVYKEHGALCPLIGCKNYGCYILSKGIQNEPQKITNRK